MRTLPKIIANTSAILASAAIALEAHKMGVSAASEESKKEGAKITTRNLIGASKLNYPSPVYSEIKDGIFKFKTPNPIMDTLHSISGYFKGFFSGVVHNLGTIGFAALTLLSGKLGKTKEPLKELGKMGKQFREFGKKAAGPLKAVGAIGLGASVIWSFIKNGTNLLEKKDYLE